MTNQLATIMSDAQLNLLTQSTPESAIKTRKGRGGKILSYVSHNWVTRQLNQAFGWQWSFEIIDERIVPEADPREVIVKGRLTVHGPNGNLIKVQYGGSDVKRLKSGEIISLADDLKAAGSDCLKKCASLLGLALDLYGDGDAIEVQSKPTPKAKAQEAKPKGNGNGNGNNLNPQVLFDEVQKRTDNYYQNIPHLFQALGSWPDFADSQAFFGAIEDAVKHASKK